MMKRKSTLIATFLTAAVLTLPWMSQANAQSVYTFVSTSGNDNNTCVSPAAACLTFAGAQSKTVEGGTISCVSSGTFGNVTITKGISIDCLAGGGGLHAILVVINAPGKAVRLQNLAINSVGADTGAIDIAAANSVYL